MKIRATFHDGKQIEHDTDNVMLVYAWRVSDEYCDIVSFAETPEIAAEESIAAASLLTGRKIDTEIIAIDRVETLQ